MDELESWVVRTIVGAIMAACVGLFVRLRTIESQFAVAKKTIGDLEKRETGSHGLAARLETVERGLVKVTGALEALPEAREFAALARSVTAVQGEIAAVRATLDGMDKMVTGVGKQLDQINAHLLAGINK